MSAYSQLTKPLGSAFPINSPNLRPSMAQTKSQPNSPADSAIGTASDSIQSPPLDGNAQRQGMAASAKSTPISAQFGQASTSEAQQPPRPPKKHAPYKNSQISLPIHEKIVCERDYERIVKETEILRGTEGTSREQLMAESKLSRECLLENEPQKDKEDRVQESRKYYYYDPIRHEYRLYYSREVRLRSETNLAALGLDIELRGLKAGGNEEDWPGERPLRRRHSAGAGRLRRAVPPPKNGLLNGNGGNGTNGFGHLVRDTTRFPAQSDGRQNLLEAKGMEGNEGNERQMGVEKQNPVEEPKTMRRGAFERNSTSRKPMQHRAASDPPRRRQWSGGAKRAALKQQQELLEQQRRMGADSIGGGGNQTTKPIPAIRQNQIVPKAMENVDENWETKGGNGQGNWQGSTTENDGKDKTMTSPAVTNQMLKELLRPLAKNEDLRWSSDSSPNAVDAQNMGRWPRGRDYDKEALLGPPSKQQMPNFAHRNAERDASERNKKPRRSIWDCFRSKKTVKNEADGKKRRKTLPESDRLPNRRLQRYIAFLLVPLFLLVAAAAIAIVVIIWYI